MNGLSPLRTLRRRRGWTQVQLAVLAGLDQTTISKLETGAQSNPDPDTVERLATALGIAPSRLRFSAPEPRRKVAAKRDRTGQTRREVA